jgi:hypothetical protein
MQSRASQPNIGLYTLLLHMPEMAQRLEAPTQAMEKTLTM